MSSAGIPSAGGSPFFGARQLVPKWTLGLMAVGLVSRNAVTAQAIERQNELLNILKVASEFKAVQELAKP